MRKQALTLIPMKIRWISVLIVKALFASFKLRKRGYSLIGFYLERCLVDHDSGPSRCEESVGSAAVFFITSLLGFRTNISMCTTLGAPALPADSGAG